VTQRDPGQAVGGQVAEESQPAGAVLGAGDLQAEQLAVPVGVDAHGDQGVHVHDPALLVDLEHQGVGGQVQVRASIQWAGAERGDLGVKVRGRRRDLRLRQSGDPETLDQLFHAPGTHPEQVAGRHYRGQGGFGAAAAFEQPIRK
jgi:hypothetical protein